MLLVSKTGFVMNPVALFMTIISDSEQYSLMLCVCRYMQVNTIKKKLTLRMNTGCKLPHDLLKS